MDFDVKLQFSVFEPGNESHSGECESMTKNKFP